MSTDEQPDEVATMPDLAMLRHELMGEVQKLHRELARARRRIRALEAAAQAVYVSGGPPSSPAPGPIAEDAEDDYPDCVKKGGICYHCERYLDGLAFADQ